jgi:Na+:H+ antiporter, NhaA family
VRFPLRPIRDFARLEASSSLVLLAATIVALAWANAAPGSYEHAWTTVVNLGPADEDLRHVVNDALMAIFFLVVGLEVKRELAVGELSSRGAALLPLFAAVGGMIAPAVLFLAVTAGSGDGRGWGIPMATDVAFALAALAALGSRVPSSLTAFLLGVAVIDDIGAILVIAVYYSDGIALGWLAGALVALGAVVAVRRLGMRHPAPFVVLGLVVWLCTFESGVHATIAGVAMGLVTPVRPRTPGTPSALQRTEDLLHPWSGYLVLPLFALANAGIVLDHDSLDAATQTPVAIAVAVGLVVGKAVGLGGGVALAVRLGVSGLPAGTRPAHIAGIGALAGIGFTVSLFITSLAYDDPALVAAAKIGVLGGSLVSAALGAALLVAVSRRRASISRP